MMWTAWETALSVLGGTVLILLVVDRIAQRIGRPPGMLFNALLVWAMFLTVLAHMGYTLGWTRALLFLAVTSIVPTAMEWVGTRWGIIFGRYRYTEKAGPTALPGIPWLIVVMWPVIIYPCLIAAHVVMHLVGLPYDAAALLLTALFATLIDLVLDPVAVHDGLWQWEKGGKWYGVPRSNFEGWFLTVLLTVYLLFKIGVSFDPPSEQISAFVFLPVFFAAVLTAYFIPAVFNRGMKKLAWISAGSALLFAGLYGATLM
ncbi:carotenoid biosynthesis protein [bacterium]|nr:carotenoid biosynthesis protein [bacterium]